MSKEAQRGRQRLLTVAAGASKGVAYSMEVRLLLTSRASPIAFAPSAPILLEFSLPNKHTKASTSARKHARCQRLLTAAKKTPTLCGNERLT